MRIAILQLSDIHFQHSKKYVANRVSQIVDAIMASDLAWEHILVVFSGDIAFSGKKAEYQIATAFATSLRTEIEKRRPGIIVHMLTVPGNHDCDYNTAENATRNLLLPTIRQDTEVLRETQKPLEHLLAVQDAYEVFQTSISDLRTTRSSKQRVAEVRNLSFAGSQVLVFLFNTALGCQLHHNQTDSDQGKLFIPMQFTPGLRNTAEDAYAIAVLHHPLNWQLFT